MEIEELEKGKWYKVNIYNNVFYKFEAVRGKNAILMEEYYDQGKKVYSHSANNEAFWQKAVEATQEELNDILPKDHPDLITELTISIW